MMFKIAPGEARQSGAFEQGHSDAFIYRFT